MISDSSAITVGELVARFLEACEVKVAYGVISIHNMPILDALHRRQRIRFVSSRGEAGACNMADASARISGVIGVCITSTGTGCGNAAGAMVEAYTAGTPLLHLTGQIESEFLDRQLGFIHEHPAQLDMMRSVGKAAFRIDAPEHAMATLQKAWQLATTAPCGPVSVEIPIDVQAMKIQVTDPITPPEALPSPPLDHAGLAALATRLKTAKRPLLWLGGGARHAGPAVQRFLDKGWGVVSSVQGRGIVDERHPQSLGSFNLQKPIESFYQTVDALLVVGSRLRSNETLTYKLNLPSALYRIDIDPLACNRAYDNQQFIQGDAQLSLDALADLLTDPQDIDPSFHADLQAAREQAMTTMDQGLGPYAALRKAVEDVAGTDIWWVRDITLSNTMWGNRRPALNHPRAGVHALGGGIGQGLAMGIGAALASQAHNLNRKTWVLSGDGGFMLNVGELSCAAQENANLVLVLMNDCQYGVIRNIQDAVYGERHCYVDLHNPNFAQLCQSMGVKHWLLSEPASAHAVLSQANATPGPCVVEVDMAKWGAFTAKFAGPPKKV